MRSQFDGFSVLLVEDDEVFAEELSDYLSLCGMQVDCASTLEAAFAWLQHETPNILILDQFLPGANSLDAIADLRTMFRGRLMLLTANLEPDDRGIALKRGADDFVSKLLPPQEILARILSLMKVPHPTPGVPKPGR